MTAASTPSTSPNPDAPPDWSTRTDEFLCPLCTYNLRGLTTPRCPECGYTFTWSALAEARHNHRYLFEHHPKHNLYSFFRTLTATLLPTRFFRTLTPFHQVRPLRLIIYWFLILCLSLPTFLFPVALRAYQENQRSIAIRAARISFLNNPRYKQLNTQLIQQFGSVQAYISQTAPISSFRQSLAFTWPENREALFFFLCFTVWPALTVATLAVYRRSTRQAAIRYWQIARCVIYSEDIGAWLGLFFLLLAAYTAWLSVASPPSLFTPLRITQELLMAPGEFWFLIFLLATYRLTRAYSQYLHMKRAWLAVPLAQLIVLLIYTQLYVLIIGISAR